MSRRPTIALLLAIAASLPNCGRSAPPAGSAGSALEREAEQAVMAEVHKHWAKSADGYTSALAEGSSFAPIRFLRQCKDISIHGVLPRTLDDSDKLNGVQFAGTAIFNETPAREAGEAGIAFGGLAGIGLTRAPGRWTGWTPYTPLEIQVSKTNGEWHVANDTTLTAGTPATAADFAAAGVR